MLLLTVHPGETPLRTRVADRLLARCIGLLNCDRLDDADGLLLAPCTAVHTCGMSFAIDVLFLDGDLRILRLVPALKPWRAAQGPRGTRRVLELAAGGVARRGWQAGQQLQAMPAGTR